MKVVTIKQFAKAYFFAIILLSAKLTFASCDDCTKENSAFYLPRPQYLYNYAQGIFSDPYYYNPITGIINQCWNFLLGYRSLQTRKSERITECLFGGTNLAFIGSTLNPRPKLKSGQPHVNADNFGLATDTYKILNLSQNIKNDIIDFSMRWELGGYWDYLEKLYAGLETSLVYSRWTLAGHEENGTYTSMPAANLSSTLQSCYFAKNEVNAFPSVMDALNGCPLPESDLSKGWTYGDFVFNKPQTNIKFANLTAILGYDFLRCDTYHIGLFAKTVTPTGTRPNSDAQSKNFFSPIIGNGHHWEFGGGIDAHWQIWNYNKQSIVAYLNGNVTHLFKDKQYRSLGLSDVKGADGKVYSSHHQLLKGINPDNTYNGKLLPGINWSTRKIESSFTAQGDASLSLIYYNCNWALGLGYNFYGRSEECLNRTRGCAPEGEWAVSGNTGVCYIDANGNYAGSLNATESNARVSNPVFPPVDHKVAIENGYTWNSAQAYKSVEPIILTDDDLMLSSIPSQMSNTLFAHLDYQWQDCNWKPWIGVGGSCESAMNGNCKVCTANTWSVWAHGGISF